MSGYVDVKVAIAGSKLKLYAREVPVALDVEELDDVELLTAQVFGSLASQESVEWWREAIECIGRSLYSMVFTKEALVEPFAIGVGDATERHAILRIGLEFGETDDVRAQALTFLPWEFLYAPDGLPEKPGAGLFLGVDDSIALYRRVAEGTRQPLDYHYRGVRMLVVLSDATGKVSIQPLLAQLDELGAQRRKAVHDFGPDHPTSSVEYLVATNPGMEELSALVGAPPEWDIIHFVGHSGFDRRPGAQGGGGKVALVENGQPHSYDAKDFAAALARPIVDNEVVKNETTALVVLQSCLGAAGDTDLWSGFRGVAPRVAAEDFPAVVAMQYQIDDETANDFAVAFYGSLFKGRPVDVAVQWGRQRLARPGAGEREFANRDFASPVLFSTGEEIVFFPSADEAPGWEDEGDNASAAEGRQELRQAERAPAAPSRLTRDLPDDPASADRPQVRVSAPYSATVERSPARGMSRPGPADDRGGRAGIGGSGRFSIETTVKANDDEAEGVDQGGPDG